MVPRLDVDPTRHSKGLAQLKEAMKGSLEVAEQNGCVSVALLPNCVDHVQIKKGLNVTLVIGNTEDATVINNPIFYLNWFYICLFSL